MFSALMSFPSPPSFIPAGFQDAVIFFSSHPARPPPPPSLIPHHLSPPSLLRSSAPHTLFFASFRPAPPFLLRPLSFFRPLFPLFPRPPSRRPMLTLRVAECGVGNRHLGRRISVSPLAWTDFPKILQRIISPLVHVGLRSQTHTLPLFLLCARIEVYILGMLACQIWSYRPSAISLRIATLIPLSLAGS